VGEIWINEPSKVFVARNGRSELTTTVLSAQDVHDLVERMLKISGRRVDVSSPLVDATESIRRGRSQASAHAAIRARSCRCERVADPSWLSVYAPADIGRWRPVLNDARHDAKGNIDRNGVLIRIVVDLPVVENESVARPDSRLVNGVLTSIGLAGHQHDHDADPITNQPKHATVAADEPCGEFPFSDS
jgi:hypothetical protein